ncbi:hypothetical protein KEM52_000764 [Ascosphaera acerosa]|nr:hypothetical protein KEM52_000764 [Ascosphaera acerosa]
MEATSGFARCLREELRIRQPSNPVEVVELKLGAFECGSVRHTRAPVPSADYAGFVRTGDEVVSWPTQHRTTFGDSDLHEVNNTLGRSRDRRVDGSALRELHIAIFDALQPVPRSRFGLQQRRQEIVGPAGDSVIGPATTSLARPTKSILKNSFTGSVSAGSPAQSPCKRRRSTLEASPTRETDNNSVFGGSQEESDNALPSSPLRQPTVKRRKVTWQDDISSPNASAAAPSSPSTDRSAALAREEIRRAITRHIEHGDSDAYDRIKGLFSRKDQDDVLGTPTPTATLQTYLAGLISNVALLDGPCSTLVQAVLDSQWLGRDEDYVQLYVKFLGTLAASRGAFVIPTLKMLANALREVPFDVRSFNSTDPITTRAVYARVHSTLAFVLKIIPSATGALMPVLAECFPQDIGSLKSHVAYTLNLIKVVDYATELRSEILALITERLVKIDVQVQLDMDEVESGRHDADADADNATDSDVGSDIGLEETLLDLEAEPDAGQKAALAIQDDDALTPEIIAFADTDDEQDTQSIISEEDLDPELTRINRSKEQYQKIDYMIDILFSYYASAFDSGSEDDNDSTHDILLAHFRSIILPTYRSRFSQFLLFHFSQSSNVLVDRFATSCIEVIMDRTETPVLRQYSAAYLASFVARGAHVSSEVVRDVFQLLGGHMQQLRSDYEAANGGHIAGPDLRRYAPFYAIAQALMYIFCFRWRDLTTAAVEGHIPLDALELDDVVFPPAIRDVMHAAVFSRLNPLKVCATGIVSEFARLSQHLNFIYVHTIIERNKRIHLSHITNTLKALESKYAQAEREEGGEADAGTQMSGYFPFDPYKLKRSGRWVEGDYIVYKGIPGSHDSQTETDDETDADTDTETQLETDADDAEDSAAEEDEVSDAETVRAANHTHGRSTRALSVTDGSESEYSDDEAE